MIEKNLTKTHNGITIDFTGTIKKETVFTMVQNCKNGQCDCMNDTTKAKIKDMKVHGKDGNVSLELSGNIDTTEILTALERSQLIAG